MTTTNLYQAMWTMEINEEKIDPTALTTASIYREISNLDRIVATRFEGMDKAIQLGIEEKRLLHDELDRRLNQLDLLVAEKFKGVGIQFDGVQKQFEERDVRVNQASTNAKTAVDAALSAQKEATADQNKSLILSINKSEQSTANQLEQQRIVLISVEKTLSDKIGEVSDRMTRYEGIGSGKTEISAPLWAMISAIITGVLIAGIILTFPIKNNDNVTGRLDIIEQSLLKHDMSAQK